MTIVPILWYRPNKDKEYFVKIRLTENKKVSYVNLNISIAKRFWYKDKITNQHPESNRLNNLITQTIQELKTRYDKAAVAPTSEKEVKKKPSVKKDPNLSFPDKTVGAILESFIAEFASNGKIGSAKKHKVVLNHAIKSKIDLVGLEEFDSSHINKFRSYLIEQGVQPQGRHTYEKVVRKIFNSAIGKGLRTTLHPYTAIRNKVPKPKPPRNLNKKHIHMLEESLIYGFGRVNLHYTSISMFLLSTFSYGMRFGDVVTLRWSNIQDLRIGYNMRKTQHELTIKLTAKHANLLKPYLPESLYPKIIVEGVDRYQQLKSQGLTKDNPIIELEHKYIYWKTLFSNRLNEIPDANRTWEFIQKKPIFDPNESARFKQVVKDRDKELLRLINIQSITSNDYIFPLLTNEKKSLTKEYNEVSSKNVIVNKELKVVAERMDIAPFSFHAARHSFANNIRDVEPDILKISRMLGHHSLSQTQDYLKRFERTEGYVSNDRFIGLHDDFFLM
jgi:integrase